MSDVSRLPWRVGTHYGIHVYAGDVPVATFLRPEWAARAVDDHNAALDAHRTAGSGEDEQRRRFDAAYREAVRNCQGWAGIAIGFRSALERLERANDRRAGLLSPEAYCVVLDCHPDMPDALNELDEARRQARDALSASPAVSSPASGWRMVPVEPTEEMIDAFSVVKPSDSPQDADRIWAAMIEAAPLSAPAEEGMGAMGEKRSPEPEDK